MNKQATLAAFSRRLLTISLTIGIGMSVLNSFLLQLIYAYFVKGNVQFAAIDTALGALISFLHIAALFACYAVTVYGTQVLGEAKSRPLLIANLVQVVCASLASLGVSYFSMTPALFLYNLRSMLLYLFLNLLLYLVILLVIRVIAVLIRRRMTARTDGDLTLRGEYISLRHPLLCAGMASTLVYIASALIIALIDTVRDFSLYGLPVNMEELVYIVTPYVEAAAYFFIGYTVMTATFYFLQGQYARIAAAHAEDMSEDAESSP